MSYCTPHENADGSEPFGKQWNEVPFFARIIHMCDTIDIFCRSMKSASDEWKRTEEFVIKSKDKLFDSFCVEVFFNAFSDEKIHMIDNETLDTMLWKKVPRIKLELNFAQIKAIADLLPILWTINHPLQVTTQWVLRKVRKKYQGSWDLIRISVRKCILPELYMT